MASRAMRQDRPLDHIGRFLCSPKVVRRLRASDSLRKLHQDRNYRAKVSEGIRRSWQETRDKRLASMHNSPKLQAYWKSKTRRKWTAEQKEARSKQVAKSWKNPAVRKRRIEGLKKAWGKA